MICRIGGPLEIPEIIPGICNCEKQTSQKTAKERSFGIDTLVAVLKNPWEASNSRSMLR